jgi:hypothetical protein
MTLARLAPTIALVALAAATLAPAARAQETATVCRDGTDDVTATCDGHGGVDSARTRAARRALKPPTKKEVVRSVVVVCADGHRTAPDGGDGCAAHGGTDHTIMTSTLGDPARDGSPAEAARAKAQEADSAGVQACATRRRAHGAKGKTRDANHARAAARRDTSELDATRASEGVGSPSRAPRRGMGNAPADTRCRDATVRRPG